MKKNFKHVLLGTFIDESLKCANLTMTHLCPYKQMTPVHIAHEVDYLEHLKYRGKLL